MKTPRAFFPGIHNPIDFHIYVFGGRNYTDDLNDCEKYDIIQNKWFHIKPLPIRKNGSSALPLDEYIFVFGGHNEEQG